jgi:serine/threonine protein kinase
MKAFSSTFSQRFIVVGFQLMTLTGYKTVLHCEVSDPPSDILPNYEVLDLIGRGGMGLVYKARQVSLNRIVAIKLLPRESIRDDLDFTQRFKQEAQTMAAMNHPAIVSVYDFGETKDGLLYFIMEFVDGTDVQKMIQASGKLRGDYALAITAHVCDALAYAHSRGVIHRDIKPANIFINREGHVKVGDFGLAKMDDPSMTSGLTKTHMAVGTPDYLAPEVLKAGMVADHRADLYAVGVMLYQMLTGEVPRGMFKLPSQKGIGSDPRFDEIICNAMEPKPEDRYQSAMDVRRALDVILTTPQPKDDGTGIVSVSQIPLRPAAMQPLPPSEQSQSSLQKPAPQKASALKSAAAPKAKAPPKKQSPTTMLLSIGGIVVVLGVAGFLVLGGQSKPQADNASTQDASAPSREKKPTIPIPVRAITGTGKVDAGVVSAHSSSDGRTIDLLPLVDLKRDVIAGEWVRTADGIAKQGTGTTGNGVPRLQLPYQPPEEYDFEVEFTVRSDQQSVGQMLSAQSRMFSWIVGGYTPQEPRAGFEKFDGGATNKLSETAVPMKGNLERGRRYVSRVEVRATGLRGLLDGVELVNWRGSFRRLSLDTINELRDDKHLGLRAARDVIFHKITVREITGIGKVDQRAPDAAPGPLSWQRVDLSSIKGLKPEGGRYRCTSYLLLEDLIKNPVRNIAVKVKAAPAPGNFPLNIMLRTVPGGQRYQGTIQTDTIHGGISYWVASGSDSDLLQASSADRAIVNGQTEHVLEFRAVEGALTLLQDGVEVASETDERLKEGGIAVQIGEGAVLSSIEYAVLDGR